jgi:DNA polymerase-4
VTSNFKNLPSATDVAQAIRAEIFTQTQLTASAGVAPNKFLAKIASDWNKPNGLCVIKPNQVAQFIPSLPVGKIPGVGQVTLQKMQALNIQTVGELAQHSQAELAHHFGRYGYRLYDLARGVDERPVNASRERQQLSKETTFNDDKFLHELAEHWHNLAQRVWEQMQLKQITARTVSIKLKTSQFKTITRSMTYSSHIPHYHEFEAAVLHIIERLTPELGQQLQFRLAGVGVAELALRQQQAQLRLLE